MTQQKLSVDQQREFKALVVELEYASRSLVEALQKPMPLVAVMAWIRAIHNTTQRITDLGISTEQQITYAVNVRSEDEGRATAALHDLDELRDSTRVPDSPEGLT